jgi:hypothetical protein
MTDVGIEAARATRREWSWLRLPLGLALALGAVAALEASPLWAALREGVASLDFDPVRTAMIAGWIGCLAAALLGGALTGRPWASVLAATAFLAATFAAPWGWHAVNGAPVVFGTRENLDALALARQLATILAAGFLLAVPGAAAGSLLSTTALALVRRLRRPDRTLLAVSVALTALLASLLLAAGIAPLLRYGPAHGLYTPRTSGKPPPAGQLLAGTFHSTAMGQDRPFAVYLPASYGKQPQRRYPVVYLLHGDPGSYRDWGNLGVTTTCDAGIAYGALPETIVAMPDGNGSVYRAAQWADGWDGRDRVEASVMELVGVIDR